MLAGVVEKWHRRALLWRFQAMNTKKEFVQSAAAYAAGQSLEKAKTSSGWAKVLWGIATAVAAAVAWLCSGASQEQPEPTDIEPAICVPEGLADSVAE